MLRRSSAPNGGLWTAPAHFQQRNISRYRLPVESRMTHWGPFSIILDADGAQGRIGQGSSLGLGWGARHFRSLGISRKSGSIELLLWPTGTTTLRLDVDGNCYPLSCCQPWYYSGRFTDPQPESVWSSYALGKASERKLYFRRLTVATAEHSRAIGQDPRRVSSGDAGLRPVLTSSGGTFT